jgi:hypothetical protein
LTTSKAENKLRYSAWLDINHKPRICYVIVEVYLLKLLLDEMYAGLKEYFEILGWEVVTAHEAGLAGVKDRTVVEYAIKNDLLLVTQDQNMCLSLTP